MKKNTKTIEIVSSTLEPADLANRCEKLYMLRTARKIGDQETVNHYVLGKLKQNYPQIEIKII